MFPFSLKDLVVRTETNKLVADLVNLDRVRSLLKMLTHRRRFLAYLENKRAMQMGQQGTYQSQHSHSVTNSRFRYTSHHC